MPTLMKDAEVQARQAPHEPTSLRLRQSWPSPDERDATRTEGDDDTVGVLRVGGDGVDLIPTDPGHAIECLRGLGPGLAQPESPRRNAGSPGRAAPHPETGEAVADERGRGSWRLGKVDPGDL